MGIIHHAMSSPSKRPNPIRKVAKSLVALRQRHAERRRATGFGFAFADRVNYFGGDTWDKVAAQNSVFLRRDVLEAIERHGPENVTPRYAMIFKDDKPVAILAAQIVSVSGEQLQAAPENRKRPRKLLARVLSPATSALRANVRERVLVAGNLLCWGFHGIAFAPGVEPAEVWPGIAEALYRLRRAERLSGQTDLVMVKDMGAEHRGLESLHRFSYRPLETEPNMVLAIDPAWRSYEDYLAALGAKYRRTAKDHAKRLQNAGCTLETISDLTPYSKRLHELYLAVQGNASVRLVTVTESYLPMLAKTLGKDFRCSIARRGEEILGFVTTLRDGSTAIAYYIGFDREAAGQGLPIYLQLLHRTIGDAIDLGCQRLSLGRTALEPKAALGAKPEAMSVWIRHRIPAFNWVLRGILGAVPHNEAPERNPFKASQPKES